MTRNIDNSTLVYVAAAAAGLVAATAYWSLTTQTRKLAKRADPLEEEDSDFALACEFASQQDFDSKMKLRLYGLYKQATAGDCPENVDASGPVRRAMAEAWKKQRGVVPAQARAKYIELLDERNSQWRDAVTADRLSTASLSRPFDQSVDHSKESAILRGDLQALKVEISENPLLVKAADAQQLTLLHIAADRGFADIVRFLIFSGADLNACDANKETPLHLAAVSGHAEVVKILIEAGSDRSLKNTDGETAAEASDSKLVKQILG